MIYEPAEDTYVLERAITTFLHGDVLEIGGGSGHITASIAKHPGVSHVTVSDIDKESVSAIKQLHLKKTTIVHSDLFENISGTFDVIICNPPYLPKDKREDAESAVATSGGKHGYEFTIKLLQKAGRYLKKDGVILMNISNQSKPETVNEFLEKNLWKKEVIEQTTMFFETLFVYNIFRSELKKQIEEFVPDMSYVARGKRSFVYKGTLEGKDCAVKVSTQSHYVPKEEAEWLEEINTLEIGPTLYHTDKEFIVMEWIDGLPIIDFLENEADEEKKKTVLEKVLRMMFTLDRHLITKEEMHSPLKHIIVQNDKSRLIDFERCHKSEQPKNVTQFVQFLLSKQIQNLCTSIAADRNSLLPLLQKYKKEYSKGLFEQINTIIFK